MNKLNPIFEALTEIDDKSVADSVRIKCAKPRRALKITAFAAAATLLLGTAAAGATFGDDPIVKINNHQVTPWHSSYVDENGWNIETTAVQMPFLSAGYLPVGEVRAFFDENLSNDVVCDELGVQMNNISSSIQLYVKAEKPGETPILCTHGRSVSDCHQSETMTPDGDIIVEIWQDPVQAINSANKKRQDENMNDDELVEELILFESIVGYPEYGGFEHPSVRELVEAGGTGTFDITNSVINFESAPSDAMKIYGYAPVSIDGFSEKTGATVAMYTNAVLSEDSHSFTFIGDKLITQQMFIYTLVEDQSGTEVLFTVWRSAENKDTYTDHFEIEYEYIQLNNGTQARLHQSTADNAYILEFEKDGAAYGLHFNDERGLAESILKKMELL